MQAQIAFREHSHTLASDQCEALQSVYIAIDGKTLHGSFDHFIDQKASLYSVRFAALDHSYSPLSKWMQNLIKLLVPSLRREWMSITIVDTYSIRY
jgi:hypothetical protein